MPAFNSCTKCVGGPCIIHDRTPDCHLVFLAWIQAHVPNLKTESSFDSQATWVIDVLSLSFDMLSMCVCTARQWQTSGRRVQELNAHTLYQKSYVRFPVGNLISDLVWSLDTGAAWRRAVYVTFAIERPLETMRYSCSLLCIL